MIYKRQIFLSASLLLIILISSISTSSQAQTSVADDVYLAYVHENTVKLADIAGLPLAEIGPQFSTGQSANIFWAEDGRLLYIARRNGLYETGASGSAATQMPGNYGITMTFDGTGDVIYYMESTNPQETASPDFVTFPFRELNTLQSVGGTGRLVGYIGEYPVGSSEVSIYGAALQYARDGGLLAQDFNGQVMIIGRPRLFTTFGSSAFYSCCFPNPGLNIIDTRNGEKGTYDRAFIPGPAGLNSTRSRLAGPTVDGKIRVIDLISAGVRDYEANIGVIERVTWALDDKDLYLVTRENAQTPLEPNPIISTPIDARSAYIVVWRMSLSTGRFQRIAELGDFYGVSSMAVTHDYVFVVAVERNTKLVEDLNAGRLPQDISLNDPRLTSVYLPSTVLFRIRPDGTEAFSVMADVWGVAARPRR